MKKYIVFAYDDYYPQGGLNDIHGSFETLEEAVEASSKIDSRHGIVEIVDRDTWEIIEEGS